MVSGICWRLGFVFFQCLSTRRLLSRIRRPNGLDAVDSRCVYFLVQKNLLVQSMCTESLSAWAPKSRKIACLAQRMSDLADAHIVDHPSALVARTRGVAQLRMLPGLTGCSIYDLAVRQTRMVCWNSRPFAFSARVVIRMQLIKNTLRFGVRTTFHAPIAEPSAIDAVQRR